MIPQHLDEKKDRALGLLASERVPPDVKDDQRDRIQTILRLERRLSSPSALERDVASHIQAGYDARKEGERDDPLCSCDSPRCALKDGSVPPTMRARGDVLGSTDDPDREATRWIQDHDGDAAILSEALDERDEVRETLFSKIELTHSALQRGLERRREEMAPNPRPDVSAPSSATKTEADD